MPFVAFLDTNVLYPPTLRDVLLRLAAAGVFQARWSEDVLDELQRAIERYIAGTNPPQPSVAVGGAKYIRKVMEDAFPEALVPRTSYERLIQGMMNHPEDRHVLAAAVAGRADVLVTSNVRHFPQQACEPYGIEVQDPDTFLVHQFGLAPDLIQTVLEELAQNRQPPLATPGGILKHLQRTVPRFAEMATSYLHSRPIDGH